MLPKLLGYIRDFKMLRPGERLGLAVSGGADSVAMLRGMLELRQELGLVLSVVHVHHGIRGPEADADAAFVKTLATEHSLELHLTHVDVPAHARENRLSLEAAGRHVRYTYFDELVTSGVLCKVATAHTFDDQAETVLLRILRGAGLQGIAGVHPTLAGPDGSPRIIRPLLGIRRLELLAYLNALGQTWREDMTNADTALLRNRVRHELLPLLERDYNPGIRSSLANLADIARADSDFLSHEAEQTERVALDTASRQLRIAPLLRLPLALQRQVLIRAAAEIAGLRLCFEEVEDLRHVAAGEMAARDLPGGINVDRVRFCDEPFLRFASADGESSTPVQDYEVLLTIPGQVRLPGGSVVRAMLLEGNASGAKHHSSGCLDPAALKSPLTLRNWRPGDRFRPLRSRSTEKLKRLFQEKKIPHAMRATWPVLLSEGQIVWVRGFPVSADHAARPGSSRAVLIEIEA